MKSFLLILLFYPLFSRAQTADDYRKKAEEANNNDNIELAIDFINKAIKISPDVCNYYAFRALYVTSPKRMIRADYKAALASALLDMNKAITLGCKDVRDYIDRGDLYAKIGSNQMATNDYQTALLLLKSPSSYLDYSDRAGIKEVLEDYIGAISDYTNAIQLDEACISCFRLYGLRAHCKAMIRDYRGALADYTKSLEISSSPNLETGEVYCNRAIVKFNIGDKNGACEDWRKASDLGYMKAFDLIKSNCSSNN